ncbi:MAG: hypothetical protein OK438_05330 [Thaumarchaeota archaeon]|nr:hypothetical protein [Nitrososphaerota archaeon]
MSLPLALADQSVLTTKQVESLLSYVRVVNGEMHLREAAGLRIGNRGKPVSIGSYYRTVQQGRLKIRGSLTTLAIAMATGLVRVEDVRRLFDLVGRGSSELSEEEVDRFVAVFRSLLDKIVM